MRGLPMAMVVLLVLSLTACSKTEFVYSNADWLIYRWTDGLLDAEGDQAERWRAVIGEAMVQHRRELLPDVVVLLQRIAEQTQPRLTAAGLECVARSSERLFTAHARLLVEPASDVLGDISPAQLAHLEAELNERNREYRETYLQADPRQRQLARFERFVERIERWTGDLNTGQLRTVQEAVAGMPELAGDWLAYREQQQRRLLVLLRNGVDRTGLRAFLSDWWVHRRDRDARLVQRVDQVRDATLRLILTLDEDLDAAQRARFHARVTDMRDDLAAVSLPNDGCIKRRAGPG